MWFMQYTYDSYNSMKMISGVSVALLPTRSQFKGTPLVDSTEALPCVYACGNSLAQSIAST